MAADHDMNAGRFGNEIQSRKIVQDVEEPGTDIHNLGFRQGLSPSSGIHISPNGGERSDRLEEHEYFEAADITGMNDMVAVLQNFHRPGA